MNVSLLYVVVMWLLRVLSFAIIGRALISWFAPGSNNPLVRLLIEVTEPILAPLRRIIPLIGMIDITPIVALFLLNVLQQWLGQALLG
ncbi:MAG: YggT family protein [Chloroflexota bacterium]|jgi:YggT family protein